MSAFTDWADKRNDDDFANYDSGANCHQNRNLVTNFDKKREPIFKEAIKQFGWDGLTITKDAYWQNGTRDRSMYALRFTTKVCVELKKFWEIVERLECNVSE